MRALNDLVMGSIDIGTIDARGALIPPPAAPTPRQSRRMKAVAQPPPPPPEADTRSDTDPAPAPAPPRRHSRRIEAVVMPPPAALPNTALPPTPLSVSDTKGARSVLVVDDDDAIRRLIVRALRTVYTVYEARDGEEASELLVANPKLDCVIMDIMMPRMSGTDLARKMRSDPVLKHVPVVFVTAKKAASEMAEGISAGARFYLSKPFSLNTLLTKVREAMAAKA
jgi:CheY-like chemotaxis protein